MLHTTAGQLVVNSVLPEDLRDYSRVLDKKGIANLLQQIAEKHPTQYRQIAHDLSRIGYITAYYTGGQSFGLDHLRVSHAGRLAQQRLRERIDRIYDDPTRSDAQKEVAVIEELLKESKPLEDMILKESLAEGNPLAMQVLSGARGNATNLRSLRGSDLLYVDHHDRPIPIPVLRSFGQGLTPAEYFGSTFGARKGVVDVKFATQDAGFFCLAEGTPVLLADGKTTRRIEQVRVGDMVIGATTTGASFPVRVSAVFRNGNREVWRFRFILDVSNPTVTLTIDATLEHQILAKHDNDTEFSKVPLGSLTNLHTILAIKSVDQYLATSTLSFAAKHRQFVRRRLRERYRGGVVTIPQSEDTITTTTTVQQTQRATFRYAGRVRIGLVPTYDIEVAHPDHLFVLGNGAIVSNSKQLNQVAHRLIVTARDRPAPLPYLIGMPVDIDDPDNEGAILAHDVGGYRRNTVLTPKVLADLRSRGIKRLLVRSPIVGGPEDGGVYAADLGIREKGTLPPVGDYVGIAAAQALSEPLSQAQFSSKHSGGVAGSAKGVSGFQLVNQLVQVPRHFKGGAAHSQVDGKVQDVRPAPQGGHYVVINGQRHYVGTGYAVKVKPGDFVEAGDVLSEGIPNPSEIVKHKGIGEGRRYFVDVFRKAYRDAGITAHRRNVELMARGLIDHVRLTEEMDHYVPDDTVPYSRLEHFYRPREGYELLDPNRAVGMYLERPVLHYSIGTKIRPSVVKTLQEFGVQNVLVHKDPPPFQSEMIRGMENLSHDPDWMTRFLGSYLEKGLLTGVHRGDVSDLAGTSYVPALAMARDFGRQGKTIGYKAETPSKSILRPPPGTIAS